MWRESLYRESSPVSSLPTCTQCASGFVKYVQFLEFPAFPLRFYVDRSSSPSGSTGVVQVHYWSAVPTSSPNFSTRFWLADIPAGGGSFSFQPAPNKPCISLFKKNSSGSFDCVCIKFIPESKLFVPQTF